MKNAGALQQSTSKTTAKTANVKTEKKQNAGFLKISLKLNSRKPGGKRIIQFAFKKVKTNLEITDMSVVHGRSLN